MDQFDMKRREENMQRGIMIGGSKEPSKAFNKNVSENNQSHSNSSKQSEHNSITEDFVVQYGPENNRV